MTALHKPTGWVLALACAGFLGLLFRLDFAVRGEEQFALLAHSFLCGRLAFTEPPGGTWEDTTPFAGAHYWPLGPAPALVLLPWQFLVEGGGVLFHQGWLQPFLVLGVMGAVFGTARQTGFGREDAGWLAFGFAFGTAFLGVALWPWSWYFSQVLACGLLWLAIWEMAGKRRPWVLGALFALVLATRATAALGLAWCAGEVLRSRGSPREKMMALAKLAAPCVAVAALLGWYNFARFGNPFEQGYSTQIVPAHAAAARDLGILSLRHLPGNLYRLVLAGPLPVRSPGAPTVLAFPFVAADPWGMSLWTTSPWLAALFFVKRWDATGRGLLATAGLIALPLLLYYGVGYRQFGYRYALDFLPLLVFALMRGIRGTEGGLTARMKTALLLTAVANLWLFAGHFLWGFQ
ncbi:MAG: hypothetical protein QOD99_1548 [Chthoniobacter sp.]|jgi:hypothetical protein|nr:hypothetical protein [Chthoniobacter sp.]